MSYKTYSWLRGVLAVILLGYGGCTIYRVALKPPHIHIGEIIFWGLGPPMWFFAEYYWFDHKKISLPAGQQENDANREAFLKSSKDYADYASKIWLAVLAAVVFLYK